MSDQPDLLPCPFCGGEASAEGMQIYSRPLSDTWWEDGSEITEAFFCNCIKCGISNVSGSVGHRTRDMAIAAWNRRAKAGQLCNSTVEMAECAAFSAGYEAGERDGGDDAAHPNWTAAAQDVLAERRRQVEAEGWTPEHDDAYQARDLAMAASCYAMAAGAPHLTREMCIDRPPRGWPWAASWWKATDRRRDLVKAGALILAEIERLDRAALAKGGA